MKHRTLLIVLLAALLVLAMLPVSAQEEGGPPQVGLRPDAPTYALHGPYWVGTKEFKAETDFHSTTVAVWYPALNSDRADETVTYHQYSGAVSKDVPWVGHAIENAAPGVSDAPYPLVIFAHGRYMARFTSAYLVEHLASHGFVVMALEYNDSFGTCCSTDTDLSMYTRPRDVSWQIDYAELLTGADGAFPGMIDTKRVAVVGHSYGAYTALMAGGAQLDLSSPTSACNEYADLEPESDGRALSGLCRVTAQKLVDLIGLESAPGGLWPSWGDSRVDAIVPLAPDMLNFSAESVANITAPTMIMVGANDHVIFSDLPLYNPYLYDNLGSTLKSLVVFDDAGHQIFVDTCDAASWLIESGLSWVCSDPIWDMDHAHDLINHFTTAFLLDVLKGDEDAHAALAPDAVSFPGIEYQAEGF